MAKGRLNFLPPVKAFRRFRARRLALVDTRLTPTTRLSCFLKRAPAPFSFARAGYFPLGDVALLRLVGTGSSFFYQLKGLLWACFAPSLPLQPSLPTYSSFMAWYASFLRGLGSWLLVKLRYKGKSFRWYKKRGSLVLRFGHSHLVVAAPSLRNLW
jgi:hypothetical protein